MSDLRFSLSLDAFLFSHNKSWNLLQDIQALENIFLATIYLDSDWQCNDFSGHRKVDKRWKEKQWEAAG